MDIWDGNSLLISVDHVSQICSLGLLRRSLLAFVQKLRTHILTFKIIHAFKELTKLESRCLKKPDKDGDATFVGKFSLQKMRYVAT